MKQILRYVAALLCPLSLLPASAQLTVASVFTDQMVLQRDKPIPVWGMAAPNDTVAVAFAGQTKNAIADADGKWCVTLDPLLASFDERQLTISAPANDGKILLTGILVGDVWLCSGQSNMFFRMGKVENAASEIATADHPKLRFFSVGEQFSRSPKGTVKGAWQWVSPRTVADCSAVAYYFGRELLRKQNVPIGLLVSSVGGTKIESWMSMDSLVATGEAAPQIEQWKNVTQSQFDEIGAKYRAFQYQRDHKSAGAAPPNRPKMRCHDCPASLHNGMIAPLQPFALRGAIWYQGEANSGQGKKYTKLLPALIADWRAAWGKEMPFFLVQLAPFQSTHPSFREAQLQVWQRTPHTALIVTTDVGDAADIHPTRKRPVGERLALAARALSYGEKIEYSGPLYDRMKIDGERVRLTFSHVGSGLMAKDGALTGFTVAGKEGKFFPAEASIQGAEVVLRAAQVAQPMHVRYGWAFVPDGNLINREGLPAVPFRTDDALEKK